MQVLLELLTRSLHDDCRFADSDVGAHTDRTPPPSDNVFVRGFAPGSSEDEVRALFAPYGLVISVRVLHHGDQSGQGGAALVRMGSIDEATRSVMGLNGQRIVHGVSPLLVRWVLWRWWALWGCIAPDLWTGRSVEPCGTLW